MWLTKTVGRKIGSLFALAVCAILLIVLIGTTLFDQLSGTITDMSKAGSLYRNLYFQSAAAFERYRSGDETALAQFKQCNAIMQSIDGVMGPIYELYKQGMSDEQILEQITSRGGIDPAAVQGSLKLIHMLNGVVQFFFDGKGLLNRLADNSVQANGVTLKFNRLFDAYAGASSPEEKENLNTEIQEVIQKMDLSTTRTLTRFDELAQNMVAPIKPIFCLVSFVTVSVLGILAFFVTRSITRPLGLTAAFAEKIRHGNLSESLEIKNRDELGTMTASLNEMAISLAAMIQDIKNGIGRLGNASGSLFQISDQLNDLSGQGSEKSERASTSVEEVTRSMEGVAAAMETSSANINQISSATEEMSVTINEIAMNAEKASSVSSDAVTQAKAASKKMNALDQATRNISQITETITDISDQTNLLALNATIEAARAGDAGKGFSVVANEIKDLAGQTAAATADINRQITSVQDSTAATIDEISRVSVVIRDINSIVSNIAAAVEQQSATTREIAGSIGGIVSGVNDTSTTVQQSSAALNQVFSEIAQVTDSAKEVSTNSREVKESAGTMSGLSDHLQNLIKRFTVRDAC